MGGRWNFGVNPTTSPAAAKIASTTGIPGPGFHCHGCFHTFDGEGNQCDGCTNMFCRACYRDHLRRGCEDRGHELENAEDGSLRCSDCGEVAVWSTYQANWWCPKCCLRVVPASADRTMFIPFGF